MTHIDDFLRIWWKEPEKLVTLKKTYTYSYQSFRSTIGYQGRERETALPNPNKPSLPQECLFYKSHDDTALRVAYQGNLRSMGNHKCSRWYFKFDEKECSGPATIEALIHQIYPAGTPNVHHNHHLEGYCENLRRGLITVGLWVGPCVGRVKGDATQCPGSW